MTRPSSRHVGSSMRNNRTALAAGLAALVILLLSLLAYCQWSGSGTDDAAPGPSTTATRPAPSGSAATGTATPGTGGGATGGGATGGPTANGGATGGATANGAATATRTATGGPTSGSTAGATGGATANGRPSGSTGAGAASVSTSDPAAPSGAPHTGGGGGLGMRNPALAGAGIVLLLAATALVVFRRRPQATEL